MMQQQITEHTIKKKEQKTINMYYKYIITYTNKIAKDIKDNAPKKKSA